MDAVLAWALQQGGAVAGAVAGLMVTYYLLTRAHNDAVRREKEVQAVLQAEKQVLIDTLVRVERVLVEHNNRIEDLLYEHSQSASRTSRQRRDVGGTD